MMRLRFNDFPHSKQLMRERTVKMPLKVQNRKKEKEKKKIRIWDRKIKQIHAGIYVCVFEM